MYGKVQCSAPQNRPILLLCLAYNLSEEVEDDTFQDAENEMYTDSWNAVDVDLSQREPVELAQEPRQLAQEGPLPRKTKRTCWNGGLAIDPIGQQQRYDDGAKEHGTNCTEQLPTITKRLQTLSVLSVGTRTRQQRMAAQSYMTGCSQKGERTHSFWLNRVH